MRSSLAVLVVAALVLAVPVAGVAAVDPAPSVAAVDPAPSVAAEQTAGNGTDPGPGVRLTGTVGVGRVAVDDRVAVARLDARLDAAGTDAERAAILDDRLTEGEERVGALEARAADVESGDGTGTAARAAVIAAEARAVERLLERVGTVAAGLDADERARYDLGSRTAALRERTAALADRFAAGTAIVDGAGVGNTTAGRADVAAAYERALADSGQVRTLFGDERIVVRVREGDGSTAVYSVRTADGAVVEATDGALADPTVRVRVEGAVVQHLARTDAPRAVFDAARDRGALTYEGVGLRNRVKFGVIAGVEGVADFVEG